MWRLDCPLIGQNRKKVEEDKKRRTLLELLRKIQYKIYMPGWLQISLVKSKFGYCCT